MKVITSDGGPIIGIGRRHLSLWMGIDGCRFPTAQTIYTTDYKWVCEACHPRDRQPDLGMILSGGPSPIIVLSQHFETAVVSREADIILIAQVEYADESWSLSNITKKDFKLSILKYKSYQFSLAKSEEFVFFDAALSGNKIADECLNINLKSGQHVLKTAYSSSESNGLCFFAIISSKERTFI